MACAIRVLGLQCLGALNPKPRVLWFSFAASFLRGLRAVGLSGLHFQGLGVMTFKFRALNEVLFRVLGVRVSGWGFRVLGFVFWEYAVQCSRRFSLFHLPGLYSGFGARELANLVISQHCAVPKPAPQAESFNARGTA